MKYFVIYAVSLPLFVKFIAYWLLFISTIIMPRVLSTDYGMTSKKTEENRVKG